jgi:hypothetical protein
MSVIFGFGNVLRFNVVTSLCCLRIVLTPGVGEACHVDESWFDRRSDRGTVKL